MTTFENLKSQWQKQPRPEVPNDGHKIILEKVGMIKRKQRITNAVLLATVSVLIGFFFYIKAYSNVIVSLGLLLMIVALAVRIMLEYFSIRDLQHLDLSKNVAVFNQEMLRYYQKRIRTHYVATPIILALYALGFVSLLPSFKENLSRGFYIYILVSAGVILFLLIFFIRKQILKELHSLRQIKNAQTS